MRKRRTILIFSLIAAICSTVALLADVETTGNLSMALNGDTIVSFITDNWVICSIQKCTA